MFDELDKNSMMAPAAKPINSGLKPAAPLSAPASAKTEDIFAEVDKSGKPEIFSPKPGAAQRGTVRPEPVNWQAKKLMMLGLMLSGLVIIVAGGYFSLKFVTKFKEPQKVLSQPLVEAPKPENNLEQDLPVIEANPPKAEEVRTAPKVEEDFDADGLTNEAEQALGTDYNSPDTDEDGLTDREEAKVYNTDPLKADTDGDTYKDGDEIRNGYNPKGAGKLLEIR